MAAACCAGYGENRDRKERNRTNEYTNYLAKSHLNKLPFQRDISCLPEVKYEFVSEGNSNVSTQISEQI